MENAITLYRWNTQLAGAFHSQLSYFEVLTRNSINTALQTWNYKECGCMDWSLEQQSAELLYEMLNHPMRLVRKQAKKEPRNRGKEHARKKSEASSNVCDDCATVSHTKRTS